MDYEKLHKETLENLQVMVNEGKITENVAKGICSDFKFESEDERIRKTLMHIVKGACDKYGIKYQEKEITEEKLLSWLEKKGTENTAELPNGEDYGIDGMYAAIDILTRTLGEVEGYQSDDGILEHECAISAVKALYERKHNGWTEEDSHIKGAIIEYLVDNNLTEWANWLNNTIMLGCGEPFTIEHGKFYYCIKDYFSGGHKRASKGDVVQALNGLSMMGLTSEKAAVYFRPVNKIEGDPLKWTKEDEICLTNTLIMMKECAAHHYTKETVTRCVNWLNGIEEKVKHQTHWKPTIDQMYAIQTAVSHLDNTPFYEIKELKSLHEDLKKLGYEE